MKLEKQLYTFRKTFRVGVGYFNNTPGFSLSTNNERTTLDLGRSVPLTTANSFFSEINGYKIFGQIRYSLVED